MAFYRPDQAMQEYLAVQLKRLAADGRERLLAVSYTHLRAHET